MFIHMVAIIIFFFGLPSFKEKLPDEPQIFTFEMLPASAISNIKDQDTKKKGRVEKQAQKIKQSKPPATKTPSQKLEEQPKDKPEEKKETLVKKEMPAKKMEQEPKEQKPKEQEQKELKTKEQRVKEQNSKEQRPKEQKKVESKPIKKNQTASKKPDKASDPLDTLMKNLEEASDGEMIKSPFRAVDVSDLNDTRFSRGQIFDENSPLSVTEKLIVKRQIEQNWRPPIGAENLEDVRVLLHMQLNEDGSLKELKLIGVHCPTLAAETCQLAVDSAVRAVKKSVPLENLMPERYDVWKEFDLHFDPSFIAQ